jgi:hypothetical protein
LLENKAPEGYEEKMPLKESETGAGGFYQRRRIERTERLPMGRWKNLMELALPDCNEEWC